MRVPGTTSAAGVGGLYIFGNVSCGDGTVLPYGVPPHFLPLPYSPLLSSSDPAGSLASFVTSPICLPLPVSFLKFPFLIFLFSRCDIFRFLLFLFIRGCRGSSLVCSRGVAFVLLELTGLVASDARTEKLENNRPGFASLLIRHPLSIS